MDLDQGYTGSCRIDFQAQQGLIEAESLEEGGFELESEADSGIGLEVDVGADSSLGLVAARVAGLKVDWGIELGERRAFAQDSRVDVT